ncbi:sialate O-acetylesterase-like [Haliotis cracherodii]|uniref:sialate O-acetylesterase-like n=1 Tax=Haliotis cracherodii TaxID=6455 RepID=UPI0039E8F2F2
MRTLNGLLLLFLILSVVNGDITFSSYYGDHMVLQRGPKHAIITGRATRIGDTVTVTVGNGVAQGTGKVTKASDGKGFWKVKLSAVTQKGPFTVTVTSSEGSKSLHDVLFGDVWVCSGQSNMEFNMYQVMNTTNEIQSGLTFTDIRLFKTEHVTSSTPLVDIQKVKIPWTTPNSKDLNGFSAICFMFGERMYPHLNYPIGLVESDWWGTSIDWWSSPEAVAKCSSQGKRESPKNFELWNAMISPLLPLSIYGVLWYQGENDAGHASRYACSFPTMIEDWRKNWHQQSMGETDADLPFGYVQLAAFRNDSNYRGGWPDTRWAQTANYGYVPNPKMKNVFMAVSLDLPDFSSPWGPVHPRFKQDVASRLILPALAVAYHKTGLDYEGPFPSSYKVDNAAETLTIEFSNGKTPIEVRNSHGYEVCCSGHKTCQSLDVWIAAPIVSHDIASVTLSTSGCNNNLQPADVRYLWWESPCPLRSCAVYGRDNDLPAPPFKTSNGL